MQGHNCTTVNLSATQDPSYHQEYEILKPLYSSSYLLPTDPPLFYLQQASSFSVTDILNSTIPRDKGSGRFINPSHSRTIRPIRQRERNSLTRCLPGKIGIKLVLPSLAFMTAINMPETHQLYSQAGKEPSRLSSINYYPLSGRNPIGSWFLQYIRSIEDLIWKAQHAMGGRTRKGRYGSVAMAKMDTDANEQNF